jgi:hypothetical protein
MRITEITHSTWYHGTTDAVIADIKTKGLQPGSDGVVWLTRDRTVAFENGAMRQCRQHGYKDLPVVVALEIPLEAYATDIAVKHSIEPKYIVDIGLTPDEQDEYEFLLGVYRRKQQKAV